MSYPKIPQLSNCAASASTSDVEREAIFRLRYQVIVERGWAKLEDMPDGLERDTYDDLALHIGAWDGETLAASSRIVLPALGLRLPTERTFEVKIVPEGEFLPERWTTERMTRLPRFAYFPFGGGARERIGDSFALVECCLVVATRAAQFRFRNLDGQQIELLPSITLHPKNGIKITVEKRKRNFLRL